MKSLPKFILPISTTLALCLAMAAVQTVRAEDRVVHGLFTPKDYHFVCKAFVGGQTEINLSQLALEKATAPAVRDFAQRMIQDHQNVNKELTQLATDKGAILPMPETKKSEQVQERLKTLSGMEFDQAYMRDMINDHKKAFASFKRSAEEADDGDLKSWAGKTLPAIANHIRLAQSVEASLNGTTKVASR
jgi:putative membrane protein